MSGAEPALSNVQALSLLLTVESFLLATLNIAITLSAPGRKRVARIRKIPVPEISAGLIVVVAVGALSAWLGMYSGSNWLPFQEIIIAGALLIAIVAQPIFAILIAYGMRSED